MGNVEKQNFEPDIISLGKPYKPVIGMGEGPIIDVDENGYTVIINWSNPTPAEIASVSSRAPFEIRYVAVDGVLFVLMHCGKLSWLDVTINPGTAGNITGITRPDNENEGTALTLLMTDYPTGVVRSIRVIGLGHKFSCDLYDEIQKTVGIRGELYSLAVNDVRKRYSTERLVKMASHYWKLRPQSVSLPLQ